MGNRQALLDPSPGRLDLAPVEGDEAQVIECLTEEVAITQSPGDPFALPEPGLALAKGPRPASSTPEKASARRIPTWSPAWRATASDSPRQPRASSAFPW